jgi:hypothetical protein
MIDEDSEFHSEDDDFDVLPAVGKRTTPEELQQVKKKKPKTGAVKGSHNWRELAINISEEESKKIKENYSWAYSENKSSAFIKCTVLRLFF